MAEWEGWESLGGGSWRTELDLMLLLSWWSWQWWCHQQWCRLPSTIHHHHLSCEGGRVGLGRGATWESGGRPSGAGRWREDDDDCQASITIFFVLPSNNHALHHINLTSSVKSSLHNQDHPFSLSPPTLCHKKGLKQLTQHVCQSNAALNVMINFWLLLTYFPNTHHHAKYSLVKG